MARSGNTPLADLGRLISWHRRKLAVLAAMAAVAFGISAVTPEPPATTPVVIAAHRLTGGQQLRATDLGVRALPVSALPDGAVSDPQRLVGRTLIAPLTDGSVLTNASVLDTTRPRAAHGLVITPIRISDAAVVALLRVGDRVDVVATGQSSTTPDGVAPAAQVIAEQVRVVTIPRPATGSGLGSTEQDAQTLILVEVTRDQATTLATAAADSRLSLLL